MVLLGLVVLGQGFPGSGALNSAVQQGGGTSSPPRTLPPKEKVPIDWRPKYLKFSYDIVAPIRGAATSQQSQELQAMLSVDKFFFAVEGGTGSSTRSKARLSEDIPWSYLYKSSGSFFRFGPEVNLIKNNKDGGALNFGLRYAQSTFSDELSYYDDLGFGQQIYTDANSKIVSRWVELTSSLDVTVWKNLHVGFTVRYKIQRGDQGIGTLKPFDIPGFGLYRNFNAVGFNYYFGWAIPLRELEEPRVN